MLLSLLLFLLLLGYDIIQGTIYGRSIGQQFQHCLQLFSVIRRGFQYFKCMFEYGIECTKTYLVLLRQMLGKYSLIVPLACWRRYCTSELMEAIDICNWPAISVWLMPLDRISTTLDLLHCNCSALALDSGFVLKVQKFPS
jgi:hypothetical protein